jgi:PhzF family phenazine biosynthesis protein
MTRHPPETRRAVIRHVDAFTATPLEGNPAAVVDGEGIDGETMQRIALNQKLSETVFLLPPESNGNHARLRIFTPAAEIPFAGHPTLAAAHTLISEGMVKLAEGESLRLETGAGVIPIEAAGDPPLYTMTQVPPTFRPCDQPLDAIASWIGLSAGDIVRAEYVSTGLIWLIAQVASLEAMLRVRPDMSALREHSISIFCGGAAAKEASIRVRTFAPGSGVPEDPVTGSSNGCIAAFIKKHGVLPANDGEVRYIAEQGIEMGQPGRVYASASGPDDNMLVRIGGHAVTVLRGELTLPH